MMRWRWRQSDALIVVDRDDLKAMLHLYDREHEAYLFEKLYPVAVGSEEHRTPTGMFRVNSRSFHPSWTMPNSDWVAPEDRLRRIPYGDPRNPIKARWIGFHQGVGFHGTADLDSIGTPASHGCLRLRIEDVIELYPYARIGTPVIVRGKQPR